MANLFDYLKWRGDLTLAQDGLNENDGLILAQLSYVAMDGVAPPPGSGAHVTVSQAAQTILRDDPDGKRVHQTGYMWANNRRLLEALADCPRFGGLRLLAYESALSRADEKQFAAVSFALPGGVTFVAYRGTDDSLVGWKEDLNLAYDSPVPAQAESVRYLEAIAAAREGDLILAGHSKGGNLSVYAAAHCQDAVRARIRVVYNFDGPGLDEGTIASPGYQAIRKRLRIYMPHFSLVGMLLEHEDVYTVVESDASGLLQHDAFSWQMLGAAMVRADQPSRASLAANHIIREWLATLDGEKRRLFADVIYEIVGASDAQTFSDLENSWTESAQAAFNAMRALDPETRKQFHRVLGELFSTAMRSIRPAWMNAIPARVEALLGRKGEEDERRALPQGGKSPPRDAV